MDGTVVFEASEAQLSPLHTYITSQLSNMHSDSYCAHRGWIDRTIDELHPTRANRRDIPKAERTASVTVVRDRQRHDVARPSSP